MAKILVYIRTSTNAQENDHQKLAIYGYARKNDMMIDEVIELHVSSRKNPKQGSASLFYDLLHLVPLCCIQWSYEKPCDERVEEGSDHEYYFL